jgi:hypothetical protein
MFVGLFRRTLEPFAGYEEKWNKEMSDVLAIAIPRRPKRMIVRLGKRVLVGLRKRAVADKA